MTKNPYFRREKLAIEKRDLLNEMYELEDELNKKHNSMVKLCVRFEIQSLMGFH